MSLEEVLAEARQGLGSPVSLDDHDEARAALPGEGPVVLTTWRKRDAPG